MVICLNLLWVSSNYAQVSFLGQQIKPSNLNNSIPVVHKEGFAVSFQPTKLGDLALLAGVNSVKVLELNYGNKFKLIKHDFRTKKNKSFNYSIHKFNRFKAYCFDSENFYVLSKNNVDGQLIYFLDVIDLNSFEHHIKNKQLIKYTSRQDQQIALFKKEPDHLILVLENVVLQNNEKLIEIFLISNDHAVAKYYPEKVVSRGGNLEFGSMHKSEENYQMVYNDRTVIKNDSGFYNYSFVLTFSEDSITNSPFISPYNNFVISSVSLGSSLVALTSSTPFQLCHPDGISIIHAQTNKSEVIELPYLFSSQLKAFDYGSFQSQLNYKFSQFNDHIFLIESYKLYYNTGKTYSKTGPGLLIKVNDQNEIEWYFSLSELIGSNPASVYKSIMCVETNDGRMFLFYKDKSGLVLKEVNPEDGSLTQKTLTLTGKWSRAGIHSYAFNKDLNSCLVLLNKNYSLRPLMLKF